MPSQNDVTNNLIHIPPGLRLVAELQGHTNPIKSLAWSPDGRYLASASDDGTVRVWLVDSSSTISMQSFQPGQLHGVAWDPTGKLLACSSANSLLLCWAPLTHRTINTIASTRGTPMVTDWALPQPSTFAYSVGWSWSGHRTLAAGYNDGSLRLFPEYSQPIEHHKAEPKVSSNTSNTPETSAASVQLRRVHQDSVYCVAWSPDGDSLATASRDKTVLIWRRNASNLWGPTTHLRGHHDAVRCLAWAPKGDLIASGGDDDTVHIWGVSGGKAVRVLSGTLATIVDLKFTPSGNILVSQTCDGLVTFWRTVDWTPVTSLNIDTVLGKEGALLSFAPGSSRFATPGHNSNSICVWDLDESSLMSHAPLANTVSHTSAKVVVVGESDVGKSWLAMSLVEGRHPSESESGTTHGMRLWKADPAKWQSGETTHSNERRELVLWDMGGQREYRLVHQLFLADTAVALIVFDPTRGQSVFEEAEQWNRQLEKQLQGRKAIRILVGAKMDLPSTPVNRPLLKKLMARCRFDAFIETSALTGRGLNELRAAIVDALNWDELAVTTRSALVQAAVDEIENQRRDGRVFVELPSLQAKIEAETGSHVTTRSLESAIKQLALQGVVAVVRRQSLPDILVLQIAEIERYAGAIILKARDNPRGVPEVREDDLATHNLKLPVVRDASLAEDFERVLIECCTSLLLEAAICFRHEGLLIFPSLFQATELADTGKLPHVISLYYDFSGAIDNIYASLVILLENADNFGRVRLWENRAEFEHGDQGFCGIRKTNDTSGIAHLDVYFEDQTPQAVRDLFINFVETHLQEHGVNILEHLEITCVCGCQLQEDSIRSRILVGSRDIGCPVCDRRILLSESAKAARSSEPSLDTQTWAIKTQARQKRLAAVNAVRSKFANAESKRRSDECRILHLSDLHFRESTKVWEQLEPLCADLRDREIGLGIESLDYLVISGDFVNRGSAAEFEVARKFISGLISELGLSADRCVIIPGNHDLSWDESVYEWKPARVFPGQKPTGISNAEFVQQGDGFLIRNSKTYKNRFKNYAQVLHHPLLQLEYPLEPDEQCTVVTYPEVNIQFIAMNSSFEIDEFFRERSGVHNNALSAGLLKADKEKKRLFSTEDEVLRIAVCHHPVSGPEQIKNVAFLERLQKANVKLLLHGHVHEDRADLIGYLHKRKVYVVGAGSFGAASSGRPESTPRLYNLLKIPADRSFVEVHTRCLRRDGGTWEGWAVWPGEAATEKRTFYRIPLK